MYNIVSNVAEYHHFVPWCMESNVVSQVWLWKVMLSPILMFLTYLSHVFHRVRINVPWQRNSLSGSKQAHFMFVNSTRRKSHSYLANPSWYLSCLHPPILPPVLSEMGVSLIILFIPRLMPMTAPYFIVSVIRGALRRARLPQRAVSTFTSISRFARQCTKNWWICFSPKWYCSPTCSIVFCFFSFVVVT